VGADGGRVQERQGGRPDELLDRANHRRDDGRLGQVRVLVATAEIVQPGGRGGWQGDTGGVAEGDHPHPASPSGIILSTQVDVAS
jgi:hypothetical protein